jgi:hypothetical protein
MAAALKSKENFFCRNSDKLGQVIDFEKGRTGHGISDLSYYGIFGPSLLQ